MAQTAFSSRGSSPRLLQEAKQKSAEAAREPGAEIHPGCCWEFPKLSCPTSVDARKLEYGFRVIFGGAPSFSCFGIRGWSYSNFLASTVEYRQHRPKLVGLLLSGHPGNEIPIYSKSLLFSGKPSGGLICLKGGSQGLGALRFCYLRSFAGVG